MELEEFIRALAEQFRSERRPPVQLVNRKQRVRDVTEYTGDGKKRALDPRRVSKLIIHRVGINLKPSPPVVLGDDAITISRHFVGKGIPEVARATGGQQPYTFYVLKDGSIEQALELYDYGPHAMRWNDTGIGIACVGDFRFEEPTDEQWESLVWLCAQLCECCGIRPKDVWGHTELPNSSADPDKECPGKYLPTHKLREQVNGRVRRQRRDRMKNAGIRSTLPE